MKVESFPIIPDFQLAPPQPLTDSGNISITVENKFTQGYRTASTIKASNLITAVTNPDSSQDICFIEADTNDIWWYKADPASATGYTAQTAGYRSSDVAQTISAFYDASGVFTVLVVGAHGSIVTTQWNANDDNDNNRLHTPSPSPVQFTQTSTDSYPTNLIITAVLGGQSHVALMRGSGSSYNMQYYTSNGQRSGTVPITPVFESLHCFWIQNTDNSVSFVCAGTQLTIYNFSDSSTHSVAAPTHFNATDVACITTAAGANLVFILQADGNIYSLGSINNAMQSLANNPIAVSQQMNFTKIYAKADDAGNYHLFGISADNKLYHAKSNPDAPGTFYNFMPLFFDVAAAAIPPNGNDLDIFTINTGSNKLNHIYLEDISYNWAIHPVEATGDGATIESFITYSSDIAVYDTAGAPLIKEPVTISATEETLVMVNGSTYLVSAHCPVTTSCNGVGALSIYQETSTLAVPTLQLFFPARMTAGNNLIISQHSGVQKQFATIQGNDLMQAKKADGSQVIGDAYRTTDNMNSLASAVNNCMQVGGPHPMSCRPALLRGGGTKPGVWLYTGNNLSTLRQIQPASNINFHICFNDGQIQYKDLSPAEATALITRFKTASGDIHPLGIFDSISDLYESAKDKLSDITDMVFNTIDRGISVAINFLIGEAEYAINKVINTIEEAFDLVEMLFLKIKVAFEDIWAWIGYVFDWDSIKRTQQAIIYTIEQYIAFVGGSLTHLQQMVDTGFDNLQSNADSLFQQAIDRFGTSTIGSYCTPAQSPPDSFNSALANNVVLNGLINNIAGAVPVTTFHPSSIPGGVGPFDQYIQQLQTFSTNAQGNPAFATLSNYYKDLATSADQLFHKLLADLISVARAFIDAVFSGLKTLADSLFQLGQALIDAINDSLNQVWQIPFVSSFYAWVNNGSRLTAIGLVSLLLAVPVTAFYKISFNEAPFPDNKSLIAYKKSFSTQTLLQNAGFLPHAGLQVKDGGDNPPPDNDNINNGKLAAAFSAFGYAINAFVSCINDVWEEELDKENADFHTGLSVTSFIIEAITQACSCPWIASSGAASCDGNDPDGMARSMWLYQNVGVVMDGVFLAFAKQLPEVAGDTGVCIEFVYAALHILMATAASRHLTVGGGAANILPVVPELAKLLRLTPIRAYTGSKNALIVLGGIDFVAGMGTGLTIFIVTFESNN